ncbi:MAG TPA: hypothetical protein VNE16_10130 [Vicinamibacterales bacterium]|nr:hypothetical protein [Vicinamibacterales bacterium]
MPVVRGDAVALGFNHYFARNLKGMIDYIAVTRRSPGMERGAVYFRLQVDD